MKSKVLVLGSDTRSCLTVVRSLGRKGIEVHLAWHEEDSIVPYSKYVTTTYNLPKYKKDEQNWLDCLANLLRQEQFDLVIPTNDRTIIPLITHRKTMAKLAKLAIPADEAFSCAFDKRKTAELAKTLFVPIPRQLVLDQDTDLNNLDLEWPFPLVIKPVSSKLIINNLIKGIGVSYAQSKVELFKRVKDLLNVTPVIVQELFVGRGVGVELLAENGRILCAFQHIRIHEPIYGGGSTYRKSVPLNRKLLDCSARLIQALNWTGVAMLEFKYNDSTNQFVLLEINGRFWGSLPLAVASGMDFPYYLYELLVEGKKTVKTQYTVGVYCRNIRSDFGWLRQNLSTRPSKYNNALPFWKVACDIRNILLMREHYDTFVLDDMRPGFCEFTLLLKVFVTKLRNLFLIYWYKFPLTKKLMYKRMKKLGQYRSICFVCKGNICRSPFAEAYLKKLLAKLGNNTITVSSAGYYKESGRSPPHNAIEAARHFQIELNTARSTIVSEATMKEHDIVFVFDIHDRATMTKEFKRYKSKIIFIGLFGKCSSVEIVQDPYGQDVEKFIQCYDSIARLLDSFYQQEYGRTL